MRLSTCPTCASRRIKKVKGSLEVHIKSKSVVVPNIEYHQCEKCGETLTDIENEKRIDAYLSRKRAVAA